MRNIWITTDTHFGHDKLVEYSSRPENFSELVMENLKKNIQKGDILIHLGDICIGNDEQWHARLFGNLPKITRILCKGNHDNKSNSWYLDHGWDFVCESFTDEFFGIKVSFSHEPIDGVKNINIHGHFHNNLHRLLEGKYVVEGEKERNEKVLAILTKNHKLLAIENTKYKPVLLQDFLTN